MSSNVDDRIVRLQYEGSGFESGAAKAIETLDKLDEKLNLDGASEGLESVKKNLSGFNMDAVTDALQNTQGHFSKWQAFVSGVFFKLGGQAVEYGEKLIRNIGSALTKSARDGFGEYEQQMKSVQTISANSGESLEVIQQNLDSLNEYADKTSYVFSDMTSAIGRFTAAGLDVNSSTTAIQGFFNAAALAGASSQDASRGVYQLSQAMSAGVVKLQDWRSIENASIDTEKFRNIIMMTADHLGVTDEKFKEAAAGTLSFRESLSSGWLTADVMQEALKNLTMSTLDYEDAEKGAGELTAKLVSEGYTEEQAKQIVAIASAADQSAREIRTFGAMMETLGESMGSGWAKTWQLIIGNYEESAEFFTWISGRFSSIIEASANARNKLFEDWKKAGGRDALIGIIANLFEAIVRIVKPIADALSDVFGITGKQLAIVTENIARFTEGLVISEESMTGIFDTFQAFFMIIHSLIGIFANGVRIVGRVVQAFLYGWTSIKSIGESTGNILEPIAQFFNHLHVLSDKAVHYVNVLIWRLYNFTERFTKTQSDSYKKILLNNPFKLLATIGENLHGVFLNLFSALKSVVSIAISFVKVVWKLSSPFRAFLGDVLKLIGSGLLRFFVFLSEKLKDATGMFSGFMEHVARFWNLLSKVSGLLGRAFSDIFTVIGGLAEALYEVFGKPILDTIKNWFGGIGDFIKSLLPNFDGFGSGISDFVLKPLEDFANWAKDLANNNNFQTFKKWFEDVSEAVGGPFAGAFEVAKTGVENFVNFISSHFSGAVSGISSWFSNFNIGNPFSSITGALSSVNIKNPFEGINIPQALSKRLGKIKDKFVELGTSADDAKWSLKNFIKQAGKKIATSGKDRLFGFIDSLKTNWEKLKNYFKELGSNGNSFTQNIAKVFGDIYNSLLNWTGKIASETSGVGSVIAGGFHWVLEQLGNIPSMFQNLFGETKKVVDTGTKTVSDGAKGFADEQKSFWGNLFSNLPSIDSITSSLGGFLDGIRSKITEGIKSLFKGGEGVDTGSLQSSLTGLFDFSDFKIVLPDFTTPVSEFIDQFSAILDKFPGEKIDGIISQVGGWVKQIGGYAFAFSGWGFLRSLTNFNKGLASEGKGLGDLFSQLPGAVEGGMKGLGKAFGKDAAGQVKEGMTNVGKSLENIAKSFSPFKKQALSKSFRQVAEGLLILAGALFVLSRIPADDLERAGKALLNIMGIAAGFTFFAAWLSSLAKLDLQGVGYAMAGLGIAMIGMVGALYLFTKMSADKNIVVGMQNFKLVLTELVAAMAILMAFSSVGNLGGVAATMIALSFAIASTIGTIAILGIMPAKMFIIGSSRLKQLGEFLVVAMVVMEIISAVGSAKALLAGVASMAALVVVITAAIVPLVLLSLIPTEMYKKGTDRLVDLRVFFETALLVLGVISMVGAPAIGSIVAMVALVAAITLAIIPITILGILPTALVDNGIKAVAKISALLAGIAVVFTAVSASMLSIIGAAVGLTLMIVPISAMVIIVGLLSALAHYDMNAISTAVESLLAIVIAIGGVALVGVYGAGGLILCAVGITLIAGALALLASVINAFDVNKFLDGFRQIGASAEDTASKVTSGFVGGIASSMGEFVASGIEMAANFLSGLLGPSGIDSNSPSKKTEEAGENSAEGFLNGVASFFGQILGSGEETGGNFLDGLADLPDKLATKASEAISTFVENLDTESIVSKGNDIVQGLIDGIKSSAWESLKAIPGEIFHAIVDPILSFFGIQSPSTYMRDTVGVNIIQGLIDGIKNSFGSLGTAAEGIVSTVKNGAGGLLQAGVDRAKDFGGGLLNTIGGFVGGARTSTQNVANAAANGLSTLKTQISTKAKDAMTSFTQSFATKVSAVRATTANLATAAKNGLSNLKGYMKTAASNAVSALSSAISAGATAARRAASSVVSNARSGLGSLYNSFYSTGVNAGRGLLNGLSALAGSLYSKAQGIANNIANTLKKALKVNSPSKVTMAIGRSVGEGLILGMSKDELGVKRASESMADALIDGFSGMNVSTEDLIDTELRPVITPVINPAEFDSSMSRLSTSLGTLSAMSIGNLNYTQEMSSKFSDYMDANEAAMEALASNAIDYDRLGVSVASALINAGVHVEMDGGQLMGYLAGEISDTRRMYAR